MAMQVMDFMRAVFEVLDRYTKEDRVCVEQVVNNPPASANDTDNFVLCNRKHLADVDADDSRACF
jgi:hypothetical protein